MRTPRHSGYRSIARPPRGLVAALALALAVLGSAVALAEPTFEPDVDYPKFDYRSVELTRPRPRLCQAECLNDARCRVWTYVRPGVLGKLASCWLKEDIATPREGKCCVSGRK